MMETLLTFAAKHYKLTPDQQQAIEALDNFLTGSDRCFILKGYAGTGKTFLTQCLCRYLSDSKKAFQLMAPTGRAARILQEKSGFAATTIHKGIYNLHDLDEVVTQKGGKEKYKFRYRLRTIEDMVATTYLIDEASMIADTYAEDDFFIFGSGFLLKDLLSHIALSNTGRADKLIFIGDSAQLPPVNDKLSGALSTGYLEEKYDIHASEYELTDVVRQAAESGILRNSIYLRQQLANPRRNTFQLQTDYPDVTVLDPSEVVSTYLQLNPDLALEKAVMVNYSNSSAFEYNQALREKYFGGVVGPQPGELLIINQNNYNYNVDLMNGTFVRIKSVEPSPVMKSGMKSYDENGEDCEVTHIFRRVVIEVPVDGHLVDVSCMILENFLFSAQRSLSYAENIALYIDFKMRHPELKPKTQEFKDALRADPYFNVLRVKFGYAITCHKAQGGEWQQVLVNMDVSQGKLSDLFLRWTYTAITRGRTHLYLYNLPRVGRFSLLEYHHRLLATPAAAVPQLVQYRPPADFPALLQQLNLSEAPPFLLQKLVEVLARLDGTGIAVNSRKAHNYQEVYTMSRDGKQASFAFHYNGRNQFTRTQVTGAQNDRALAQEALAYLTRPFNYQVLSAEEEEGVTEQETEADGVIVFPADKQELAVLCQELSPLLKTVSAKVAAVLHHPYQEVYTIVRPGEAAVVKFYYDGRNRFTTAEPDLAGSSNALLEDIHQALQTLKHL